MDVVHRSKLPDREMIINTSRKDLINFARGPARKIAKNKRKEQEINKVASGLWTFRAHFRAHMIEEKLENLPPED